MLVPWWLKSIDTIFLYLRQSSEISFIELLFVYNNQLNYQYLEMNIVLFLHYQYVFQYFL
jgi:hypothetical protein